MGKSKSKPKYSGTKKSNKKSKRSIAAKKAWITRTRNEGTRQLLNAATSLAADAYGKVKTAKDIVFGLVKVAAPRVYRQSKMLKELDKAF
jgi:hypothetical protein